MGIFLGTLVVFLAACLLVGAGLIQLIVSSLALRSGGNPYPTIGASGGVFGLLLAYGVMWPENRIFLIFFPVQL